MADSFCCLIETNNIVKQLYSSKINLKIKDEENALQLLQKKKDHVRKPDNTCNQTGASPLQVFRHPQLGEKK